MPSLKSSVRTVFISLTTIAFSVLSSSTPLAGFALADSCTPPSSSQAGVHWPTGSDASTFTYQCSGPYSGEWTNAYYVFNPSDLSRTPLYSPDYAYNCDTGVWTKVEWDYSAADSQYHQNRVTTDAPAGVPTGCPVAAPAPSSSPSSTSGASSTGGSTAVSGSGANSTNSSSGGSINTTGPGSSNTTTSNGTTNTTLNNASNASMTNSISGVSTSGNSLVLGNTQAGNATSGNTTDVANIVNLLQSSSNALGIGGDPIVFTANIDGTVNGDLLLDPSQLTHVQDASGTGNLNNTVTVNNASNTAINNNIDLAAQSGNAAVSGNNSGGNATSGAADVVANIVNSIDSALMAGKSFIGTININGNLNGNILLPPDFVDQLLAANVPTVTITAPASINNATNNTTSNTTVTNTNNLGITNNVNANAAAGSADVSDNTAGGNATSGNATTNITAFNLTGSDVVGANDILVFVNNQGTWYGMIVGAPAGATAASFGGGITASGPGSTNTANNSATSNTDIANIANETINNNVATRARSGDATVHYNTQGGNAQSGNAGNAVNLLNMEHSHLNLSGWLGILFINVFGTWNGSFGVAGRGGSANTPAASGASSNSVAPTALGQVFHFVPTTTSSSGNHGSTPVQTRFYLTSYRIPGSAASSVSTPDLSQAPQVVLAAQSDRANTAPAPSLQSAHRNMTKTFAIIGGTTALYIASDAFFSRRKARQTVQR